MKITAIILVGGIYDKNLLTKCLNSVSWCDEIVKVETDGLKGSFADWRNEGARKSNGDWLLYVDTDEEITDNLQKEIEFTINNLQFTNSAYAIPRRNFIFGKEMKHCGLWPDFVLRLIKKDKLKGWTGDLHEQPKVDGKTCHLKESLIHNKHKTLAEMVEKTNDWSEIEARLMFDAK
ncbi:MAG: Glycosyl transferase family 2, partial [Candidatus Amesbacteria bacterium GW2011_GWA1_47_20]